MDSSKFFSKLLKSAKINHKKNVKAISTFNFSALYITIPHNLLIKFLNKIVSFVFNYKRKREVGFSESSMYWTTKGVDKRFFTQQTLKHSVSFLIKNSFFTIGNLVFKQDIGILMGRDPAPFWAIFYLFLWIGVW